MLGGPKLIKGFEEQIEKQLNNLKPSLDKNLQKATKILNITIKKDENSINSGLRSL